MVKISTMGTYIIEIETTAGTFSSFSYMPTQLDELIRIRVQLIVM